MYPQFCGVLQGISDAGMAVVETISKKRNKDNFTAGVILAVKFFNFFEMV
jgi:hypothetical protein